jgi:hypothetical protein
LQSTWFVPPCLTLQLPYLLLLWYTPSCLGLRGFWPFLYTASRTCKVAKCKWSCCWAITLSITWGALHG